MLNDDRRVPDDDPASNFGKLREALPDVAIERLVEGAVGMVDGALRQLEERKIVELSPAQRAVLVPNMVTVLPSGSGAQPGLPRAKAWQDQPWRST